MNKPLSTITFQGIIILLACVYWTVDCYPLADGVGLSHGSSQTAQTHHSSHGVLATPRAQPAPHHASHGISSGYGYSGGISSGYDSGYSSGYEGGHSSGGYGYDEKPDPFQFEYGMIIITQTSVSTDLEMKLETFMDTMK